MTNRYTRWIESEERKAAAIHEPFKTLREFEWGLEYLGLGETADKPEAQIAAYSDRWFRDATVYFSPLPIQPSAFSLDGEKLSFPTPLPSKDERNDRATCTYFPHASRRGLAIVIPHWNNDEASYDQLGRIIRRTGISVIRVTLPYHGTRGFAPGAGWPDSTAMVSPNIGRTLLACRQAVQEVLTLVH